MEPNENTNKVISNSQIHTQSFELNPILLKAAENGEKVALAKLKSIDNLILSTFAKYLCPTGLIVFKDLILITYNRTSKAENYFVLNIPDLKISNKNFNIGRIMYVSMAKLSPKTYLVLIILVNLIFIISIEEDAETNELKHRIIYKDKKMNNRYLILGAESFENQEVLSLISKPSNKIINITCALNSVTREIEVKSYEKQLDKSKYQFDRFTQSACNWILFTEKNDNKNIMLDKSTLRIYTLDCDNDLLNHSFFLMNNDDQLHLITDIEENKKVYVYLLKLTLIENESKFNSELIKVYEVPCDNYEKYVFNALNGGCFFVNFYETFVAYFYSKETKAFNKCYRFDANCYCLSAQSFNFNCFNDGDDDDKTHMMLETYKDKKLILVDYQLNERLIEVKVKGKREREGNNEIEKNSNEEKQITIDQSETEAKKDQSESGKNEKEEEKNESKEVSSENQITDEQKKDYKATEMHKNSETQKQFSQIEQKVDQVIENQIDSISYKIVSKYKNILKNLEIQTKKMEQKQTQFESSLENVIKNMKLKETQIHGGHQLDKVDDSNNNRIRSAPVEPLEYSIEQNKFIRKEDGVTEQKDTQQHDNNSESQINNGNNNEHSFFPKQFQGQNIVNQPINPQIMGLMMNLMSPINQMYTMLLNTLLQNRKNMPQPQQQQQQQKYQNRQNSFQTNQQNKYQNQPQINLPISAQPSAVDQSSMSIQNTPQQTQKCDQPPERFNLNTQIFPNQITEGKTKDRPQNSNNKDQQHFQKKRQGEDDFKEVVKKKKYSKKSKMKNYNEFKSTIANPYEASNSNKESNENNSNDQDVDQDK